MKEHAAAPVFGRLPLIGTSIFHDFGRLWPIGAPEKRAPLINRVERVENDQRASQRNSRIDHPPAEPGHQLALGSTDQAGLGHPGAEGVESRVVHKLFLSAPAALSW